MVSTAEADHIVGVMQTTYFWPRPSAIVSIMWAQNLFNKPFNGFAKGWFTGENEKGSGCVGKNTITIR
jgi:hypothetical protein